MPDEDPRERTDREFMELLNELRVAIPGVQVLFAFLLTAPFNQRFGQTTQFQRDLYLAALLTSAAASALLIATAAQHRLLFRQHSKEALLRRGNRLAISGFLSLAVAIVCSLLLVTDFLFGGLTSAIVAVVVAGSLGWLWLGMALAERRPTPDLP
jgi:Flp pilus assembly protein TadB